MTKKMFNFLLLFTVISSALVAQDFDYDMDGLSDIVVTDKANGTYTWSYYSSSSNFQTKVPITINGEGKATPILGQWGDAGTLTPGTLRLKRNAGRRKYHWNIFNTEFVLGSRNSRVVTGFNINNNAITDFLIILRNGRVNIFTDYFVSGQSTLLKFNKSLANNAFPVVADASGLTLIGFVRAKKSKARRKAYMSKFKDLNGNMLTVNFGREPGTLLGAYGISTNDSLPNSILLVLKRRRGFRLVVKSLEGTTIASRNLSGNLKKITVDNFSSSIGEEILYTTNRKKFIINLFDGSFSDLDLSNSVSGVVREAVNIFSKNNSSGATQESGTAGPGISSVCSSTGSPPTGVLWKPDSDVSDNRGGKPVILFQGGYKPNTGAVKIFAVNGTQIGHFTYKAPNESGINGNADHYYSGWVGGSSETGGELQREAQATAGSPNVYFQGRGSRCFGPVNPDGRSGAIN